MHHPRRILPVILFLFYFCGNIHSQDDAIFGEIQAFDYVTGKFRPEKHSLFVKVPSLGIPCRGNFHYLRKEAASALKKLYDDFRKDHPRVPFWVQSSTRDFWSQKYIWESKWNGIEPVAGERLDKKYKEPEKRGLAILAFSSMPGTSRHHWGTEVDFNVLMNSYFEKGDGKVLYEWLKQNARSYGFCQPYTQGRNGGYCEERWHWSYVPLSSKFLDEWNMMFSGRRDFFTAKGLFAGSETVGNLAPLYVNEINGECR